MSIENPYSQNFGWKVDPDNRQDRSNGPCTTRLMTEEEKKKYGIKTEGADNMKITKEAVKKFAAEGKSNQEIADYYMPYYPGMKRSLMLAKISMMLNDKKLVEKQRKLRQKRPRLMGKRQI